ncbi:MAG: sigma-70 family RNA polymerase sigma factor [Pedosphaera sp.]|nr:sigma-70 family RNA polymerase sigma factor [Pedosphaera sp.]
MLDRKAADETQNELLRRIAAQDREALAGLYDQLAGVLFAVAMRILGDQSEAEEVMQDVFVQVWERANTFDPALGTPTSWVLRIARNRAIDRLRARQRRNRALDEFETARAAEPFAPPPVHGELNRDELAGVHAALAGLPADQRQVIELAFFRGLSHGEIAEALRQPLGTVKARIRRGMLKLKDTLQAYA